MAKILLTDKGITAAKPAEKVYVLADLRSQNLNLVVHPTGSKVYVWRGRLREKTVSVTLGNTQVHPLADAREWADALTADRDKGVDIRAAKAAQKVATVAAEIDATRTVDACFEFYFEHDGGKGKDAAGKRAKYEREIQPLIGDLLINDITFDDLSEIVADKAEEWPGAANKLHALIARMWRWLAMHPLGRQKSGLKANVYAGAFLPSATGVRNTFLRDDAVRWLYRALDEEPAEWRHFYRLVLLTGARRSEISRLRWPNIRTGDGKPHIYLGDTKNDRAHVIPLSPVAMVEIEALRSMATGSRYIFPAEGNPEKPISGFSNVHKRVFFNAYTFALSETPDAQWDEFFPYFTLHDFRRTMRTWMSREENEIDSSVAEAIISHTGGKTKLQATYDLYQYYTAKERALTLWGERVAAITA